MLPRKFLEDPIWTERRTFSKAEAWLDMFFHARYSEAPQEVMLGLTTYTCRRGECLRSRHVRRLSDAGRIPGPVRIGILLRWNRQERDNWIAGGCCDCRSQNEETK